MEYTVLIAVFCFVIPLTVFSIFRTVADDRRARNNVMNSDPFGRHFCFVLDCDRSDTVDKLCIRNYKDNLEYTFDADRLLITFSHSGVSIEYQLSFYIFENRTYLKVSRVRLMHGRSNIPYMVNRFFVDKLGATAVEYSFFEAYICPALNKPS